MKDFLTIFLALSIGVGGFMAGRNYGEKTFRESADYKNLMRAQEEANFTRAELENIKAKFQNIADGADGKKQEELLAQILQVFLADLGLRIANQQAILKTTAVVEATPAPVESKPMLEPVATAKPKEEKPPEDKSKFVSKLKSYEWILTNSRDSAEVRKNLKNVEVKDLGEYLKLAKDQPIEAFEPIFGSYRGRMFDIDKKEYASMVIDIKPNPKGNGKFSAKGEIRLYSNGREYLGREFETDNLGYAIPGSEGFMVNPNEGNKFWHLYKVKDTQQIAGYMYERNGRGSTRTLGSFVLNRTDKPQF